MCQDDRPDLPVTGGSLYALVSGAALLLAAGTLLSVTAYQRRANRTATGEEPTAELPGRDL